MFPSTGDALLLVRMQKSAYIVEALLSVKQPCVGEFRCVLHCSGLRVVYASLPLSQVLFSAVHTVTVCKLQVLCTEHEQCKDHTCPPAFFACVLGIRVGHMMW